MPLDGSGSSDADSTPGTHDDLVAFEWLEDLGLATQRLLWTTEVLEVALTGGVHATSLRVTDAVGGTATDEAVVSLPCAPPSDGDGDGIADAEDNCPGSANPGQQDACDALFNRWIFELSPDAASTAPGDRVEYRYRLVNNLPRALRGILSFRVVLPSGSKARLPGSLLCAGGNPRREVVPAGGLLQRDCFVEIPGGAEPGSYKVIGRLFSPSGSQQHEIAIDLAP